MKTNEIKSTREQALEWWDNKNSSWKKDACSQYYPIFESNYGELIDEEIESIWLKEVQHQSEERTAQQHSYKPSKDFNPELFKAYKDKYDDNASKHMIRIIAEDLNVQDLRFMLAMINDIIGDKL